MSDSNWKQLADELQRRGRGSTYVDRLRERSNIARGQQSLEAEILAEMASSLGRAEDKVNAALLALEVLGARHDEVVEACARHRASNDAVVAAALAFDAQRERALRARLDLLIQREAIGLRNNAVLEDLYPVPPRRHRGP